MSVTVGIWYSNCGGPIFLDTFLAFLKGYLGHAQTLAAANSA